MLTGVWLSEVQQAVYTFVEGNNAFFCDFTLLNVCRIFRIFDAELRVWIESRMLQSAGNLKQNA